MTEPQIHIRSYRATDEAAVIALWHECRLVRPQNDPKKDIARKLKVNPELFLVAEREGRVVGTVMAATRATAAGSTTWACRPRYNAPGLDAG